MFIGSLSVSSYYLNMLIEMGLTFFHMTVFFTCETEFSFSQYPLTKKSTQNTIKCWYEREMLPSGNSP